MSAPASDPPQDPPTGIEAPKPEEASSSASSSSGEQPAEGDVKMEEAQAAKPETIEDTLEDIPDHVKEVRSSPGDGNGSGGRS
jgi:hypothetical protein